jgi:hypothetical protein
MGTIIILIMFLLSITMLIGLLTLIDNSRKRKARIVLENSLNTLVRKHNLLIGDVEFFREKAIGLDIEKKKLVYVEKGRNERLEACISLSDFKFCLLYERKDSASGDAQMFLELVGRRKNENVLLKFLSYASDRKNAKTQLTQKAQYWKNKINQLIKGGKTNMSFEYVV